MVKMAKNKRKAFIAQSDCVGCGKCAKECPASVIEIREVVT